MRNALSKARSGIVISESWRPAAHGRSRSTAGWRPLLHLALVMTITVLVTSGGWVLGIMIRPLSPGTGLMRFLCECALWLMVVAAAASPLLNRGVRERLDAMIPK